MFHPSRPINVSCNLFNHVLLAISCDAEKQDEPIRIRYFSRAQGYGGSERGLLHQEKTKRELDLSLPHLTSIIFTGSKKKYKKNLISCSCYFQSLSERCTRTGTGKEKKNKTQLSLRFLLIYDVMQRLISFIRFDFFSSCVSKCSPSSYSPNNLTPPSPGRLRNKRRQRRWRGRGRIAGRESKRGVALLECSKFIVMLLLFMKPNP